VQRTIQKESWRITHLPGHTPGRPTIRPATRVGRFIYSLPAPHRARSSPRRRRIARHAGHRIGAITRPNQLIGRVAFESHRCARAAEFGAVLAAPCREFLEIAHDSLGWRRGRRVPRRNSWAGRCQSPDRSCCSRSARGARWADVNADRNRRYTRGALTVLSENDARRLCGSARIGFISVIAPGSQSSSVLLVVLLLKDGEPIQALAIRRQVACQTDPLPYFGLCCLHLPAVLAGAPIVLNR
jgi:hypothetical protein